MAEALVVIEYVLPPTVEVKLVMLVDKAASALALVVASVLMAEVFVPTVEVKLVILVDKALSALALVVASVLMAEVLLPTVEVKLVIAEALAEVSVVRVTMSPCAVAMFVVLVPTVLLNVLYRVTKEESLALTQPLLAAFLT